MPATTAPVRNLIAANMSIRREVFVAVGGFLRGFGKVGTCSRPEETELCIRALQRWPEAVWLYTPPALVYHRVPAHRACWRYFVTRCYHEGLGKAALVGFLGVGDGLASERAYTFRTLPTGVIRGLADTILRRDVGGMTRATAIVAGLTMTAAGYLMGRASAGAAHSTELDNQERPLGWSVA
jgi:hypothetical protein